MTAERPIPSRSRPAMRTLTVALACAVLALSACGKQGDADTAGKQGEGKAGAEKGPDAVPVEAVARKAVETKDGTDFSRRQAYVTVRLPDGSTLDRDVVAGINDGYDIEIVSGLAEGETVVFDKSAAADSRCSASVSTFANTTSGCLAEAAS